MKSKRNSLAGLHDMDGHEDVANVIFMDLRIVRIRFVVELIWAPVVVLGWGHRLQTFY